jgi:hypothetical protein
MHFIVKGDMINEDPNITRQTAGKFVQMLKISLRTENNEDGSPNGKVAASDAAECLLNADKKAQIILEISTDRQILVTKTSDYFIIVSATSNSKHR